MANGAARPFRTLRGTGVSELETKRSRFLGRAAPVRVEADVQALLAAVRAEHPEAGTHAFAYRLGMEGAEARFSDDGEPGGTAGRPMMEVLLREELVDATVVVTRYFGGTLLGAGGLTRAFGQTATLAIHAAGAAAMRPHTELSVTVDYAQFGALEQSLERAGLVASESGYGERVTVVVPVPAGEEAAFAARLADLTAGAGLLVPGRTIWLPE